MKGLARDLGRLLAKERVKTDPEDLSVECLNDLKK